MILISHRGNINGPNIEKENTSDYIEAALNLGFNVEIDVWYLGHFFLGHDKPQYFVTEKFLQQDGLWCHAKNIPAMVELSKLGVNYFWHERDKVALTSNKFLWTYPGQDLTNMSIACLPEVKEFINMEIAAGICSDYIKYYKK